MSSSNLVGEGRVRCVEATITVVATLTQQYGNVLDYLTAACEAPLRVEAAPSLPPPPAALA